MNQKGKLVNHGSCHALSCLAVIKDNRPPVPSKILNSEPSLLISNAFIQASS